MSDQHRKSCFTTLEIQKVMFEESRRYAPTSGSFRVEPKDTLQDLDRRIDRWILRGVAPYAAAFGRWARE